jgi:hypothetical protein
MRIERSGSSGVTSATAPRLFGFNRERSTALEAAAEAATAEAIQTVSEFLDHLMQQAWYLCLLIPKARKCVNHHIPLCVAENLKKTALAGE